MTFVANKITEPGGIKTIRVELNTVEVSLHNGQRITYSKTAVTQIGYRRHEEIKHA